MHEMAVTENILEIALRHGESANADKITDLYLVIGQLSSIVDDSVQFYWDLIAKGTPAEGAHLHFTRIQTCMKCRDCSSEFAPTDKDFSCPVCNSNRIEITAGDEFYLDSIDVET